MLCVVVNDNVLALGRARWRLKAKPNLRSEYVRRFQALLEPPKKCAYADA